MSLKGRSCWVVNIRMNDAEKLSLEAIGQFVAASEEVRFEAQDRQQVYDWVEQVLVTTVRLNVEQNQLSGLDRVWNCVVGVLKCL